MTDFTEEEMILMMLYNPGSRLGLKKELIDMRKSLRKPEWQLKELTNQVLDKLEGITDEEFDSLPLYPDYGP